MFNRSQNETRLQTQASYDTINTLAIGMLTHIALYYAMISFRNEEAGRRWTIVVAMSILPPDAAVVIESAVALGWNQEAFCMHQDSRDSARIRPHAIIQARQAERDG